MLGLDALLSMRSFPSRKRLGHLAPHWVDKNSPWFITLCCASRVGNQLSLPRVHEVIRETFRHRESIGQLKVLCYVLMPDHAHLIATFNSRVGMEKVIVAIKRLIAAKAGVRWQKGFFDHRLRSDFQLRQVAHYVRMNPVRKGLAENPQSWPYSGP
jgi:REP element-mobilizing transposase RayT